VLARSPIYTAHPNTSNSSPHYPRPHIAGNSRYRMNKIKSVERTNEAELALGISGAASWHQEFAHSPYIYVGGLPFELTEGDILVIFSQYALIEFSSVSQARKMQLSLTNLFFFSVFVSLGTVFSKESSCTRTRLLLDQGDSASFDTRTPGAVHWPSTTSTALKFSHARSA
jgi:hypothetical protein